MMTLQTPARAFLALMLLWLACPGPPANSADWPLQGIDSQGDAYAIGQRPQRVVSLVPEITEILIALGAADALMGVTMHDKAPAVAAKPSVGGFQRPDIARIAALAPDLILGADLHHEARGHFRDKARFLTLNVLDIESAMGRLALLGRIFDRQQEAAALIAENRGRLARVAAKSARRPAARKLRVARLMGNTDLLVPGDNSFQNDFIRAAGAIAPVFGRNGQAIIITPEEWRRFDPQAVYYCGPAGILPEILSRAGVKEVSAVRSNRVYSFACDLTCRAGVNMGAFVSLLADRLYGKEPADISVKNGGRPD